MSKCFGVRNLSKWSKVSERLSFHCTTETAFRQDGILLQWASLELAPAVMRVSIEIRNFSVHGRESEPGERHTSVQQLGSPNGLARDCLFGRQPAERQNKMEIPKNNTNKVPAN
jgi:hypothetical protein